MISQCESKHFIHLLYEPLINIIFFIYANQCGQQTRLLSPAVRIYQDDITVFLGEHCIPNSRYSMLIYSYHLKINWFELTLYMFIAAHRFARVWTNILESLKYSKSTSRSTRDHRVGETIIYECDIFFGWNLIESFIRFERCVAQYELSHFVVNKRVFYWPRKIFYVMYDYEPRKT